jgi:hypothetical protein
MPRLALLMNIDAARQIEHPVDRCGDVRRDFNPWHGNSGLPPQPAGSSPLTAGDEEFHLPVIDFPVSRASSANP